MPKAYSPADAHVYIDTGPRLQVFYSDAQAGIAPSVAAGGNTLSPVISTNGYTRIACGVTSSQGGTLVIQRYVDDAGTVPQGPALSVTLAAGVANVLNVIDGNPFSSFTVEVTNSGSASATLSNFGLLIEA